MPTKTDEKAFLEGLKTYDPGPLVHIVLKRKGELPKPGDRALCGHIIKGVGHPDPVRPCQVCENHWDKIPDSMKGERR